MNKIIIKYFNFLLLFFNFIYSKIDFIIDNFLNFISGKKKYQWHKNPYGGKKKIGNGIKIHMVALKILYGGIIEYYLWHKKYI